MLEKIRKHSLKMIVFVVNILLMGIAIFVIKEKDRSRLFQSAKENLDNRNDSTSFEGQLNQSLEANQPPLENSLPAADALPAAVDQNNPDANVQSNSNPTSPDSSTSSSSKSQNTPKADRRTKTS